METDTQQENIAVTQNQRPDDTADRCLDMILFSPKLHLFNNMMLEAHGALLLNAELIL